MSCTVTDSLDPARRSASVQPRHALRKSRNGPAGAAACGDAAGASAWARDRDDHGGAGPPAHARRRPGRRLPAVRPPAGRCGTGWAASSSTTPTASSSRSRASPAASPPSSRRSREGAAARPRRRRRGRPCPPRQRDGVRIVASRAPRGGADADPARRRDLRRLPARALRPGRPPLPLPVRQLHELRAALHDRHARVPYDRPQHDDGRLRAVPRLPPRVRGPGRPPLPRRADRLPRLRAARSTLPLERGRSRLLRGGRRSSRSRASAATTSPATRPTRRRSRGCGRASTARRSRSP